MCFEANSDSAQKELTISRSWAPDGPRRRSRPWRAASAYTGTSVEMIEKHYGRYMQADAGQLVLVGRRVRYRGRREPRALGNQGSA